MIDIDLSLILIDLLPVQCGIGSLGDI